MQSLVVYFSAPLFLISAESRIRKFSYSEKKLFPNEWAFRGYQLLESELIVHKL